MCQNISFITHPLCHPSSDICKGWLKYLWILWKISMNSLVFIQLVRHKNLPHRKYHRCWSHLWTLVTTFLSPNKRIKFRWTNKLFCSRPNELFCFLERGLDRTAKFELDHYHFINHASGIYYMRITWGTSIKLCKTKSNSLAKLIS